MTPKPKAEETLKGYPCGECKYGVVECGHIGDPPDYDSVEFGKPDCNMFDRRIPAKEGLPTWKWTPKGMKKSKDGKFVLPTAKDEGGKKCGDCIHCKPDTTGKLRYCAEEYMGFPHFADSRKCPGFEMPTAPADEGEESALTSAKKCIGNLTMEVRSLNGKIKKHTTDANAYIVKLETAGYEMAVDWAYAENERLDLQAALAEKEKELADFKKLCNSHMENIRTWMKSGFNSHCTDACQILGYKCADLQAKLKSAEAVVERYIKNTHPMAAVNVLALEVEAVLSAHDKEKKT